jgi:hypothetical protein
MYKKTLLSVAIASALSLTGCLDTNNSEKENKNANTGTPSSPVLSDTVTDTRSAVYPMFNPGAGDMPLPNDIIIQQTNADGTYEVPGLAARMAAGDTTITPPEIALENLSGASLVAPIDIEIGAGDGVASIDIDTSTVKAQQYLSDGSQSVYLIELEYASDNPLQGLGNKEAPAPTDLLTAAAMGPTGAIEVATSLSAAPKYDAEVITRTKSDGSTGTYIRIQPLVPLNPNKRYVIALTDDIKTMDGDALVRQPGLAAYDALSDETRGIANNALEPIAELVNGLWEPTALSYIDGITNFRRSEDSKLSNENIIFSLSFTTSNDTKVVDYMVNPAEWATDTVKSLVKTGAAKAAVEAGLTDYASIAAQVKAAYEGWTAASLNPLLAECDEYFPDGGNELFACAGQGLIGAAKERAGLSFPEPTADDSIAFDTPRDLRTVSAAITDAIAPAGAVNISEGSLTIPYFSGVPNTRGESDGSEARLVGEWWKADSDLASGINDFLGLEAMGAALPQATTSNTVNHLFPFPKKNSTEEIPVLAVFPADDANKPAGGYKTVIYQHGITTDRSVALALGSAIVNASGGTVAVLAIDQPLHGIDAISEDGKLYWAETFLGALQGSDQVPEDIKAILAPGEANNLALASGTLARSFVTNSLAQAGAIADPTDLTDTEQGLVDAAFLPAADNTLAQSVVTGTLHSKGVINIADDIDANEAALIASAFDGTLATDIVSVNLQGATLPDMSTFNYTDGLNAIEQAVVDAFVDEEVGNSANSTLEESALGLVALETAATETLPGLKLVAQNLALMQTTIANGASQVPGLGQGSASERHFGFAGVSLQPTPMDFEAGTVGTSTTDRTTNTGSGALTINPLSFLTSRDNFRQGIVDLMGLRLSVPNMDLDSDGQPDLNGNDVHFLAHSLGTFNGIPFVEIANQTARAEDNIVTANFLTPGGNIARVTENSSVFAPGVLLALQDAGIERGDADFELFLNALTATFDSFDPINFVGNLSTTTSTTKALFTEVAGDTFIPNHADPAIDIKSPKYVIEEEVVDGVYSQETKENENENAGMSFGPGTDAPLAGTTPLQTISGAVGINSTTFEAGINFVRFTGDSGVTHTTPAYPSTPGEAAGFGEVVQQAISFITTGGNAIQIGDSSLLEVPNQ